MADHKKDLTDSEQSELHREIEDAESYIDAEVGPDRAKATDYYHARPFGNEEEGRSQVVSPDVHDTVIGILPDLIAAFLGPENIVEYAPRSEEDVAMAEQATDYVSQVVLGKDNKGFRLLYDAFSDALIRKTGVIKWYWEDESKIETTDRSGVDAITLQALSELPDTEVEILEERFVDSGEADGFAVVVSDIRVTHTEPFGRVRVEALPPEEFLINRDARDIESARYIGHRTFKSVDELVEMGYDRDEVEKYAGSTTELEGNLEAQARSEWQNTRGALGEKPDSVKVIESYYKIDGELHRIVTIGGTAHVLENEPAAHKDFALLCPRPEPHAAIGYSLADEVGDIQRIKSALMRNMLDSAESAIFPRTVILENSVNIDDVLSTEMGALIRVRGNDVNSSIRELVKPFIGSETLPLLQYIDQAREERTGVSRASAGLNPDALQSATRKAVDATISGRERQGKMIAMLFAHALEPMYRGILRLLVEHQDKARTVRLRNKWVEVRPDSWNADMDVEINQGVGGGTIEDRIATLNEIIAHQGEIIQNYGLSNPLVSLPQYRFALAKRLELSGIKDSSHYYSDIPDNWQPPQQQQGQGDEDPLITVQKEAIEAEVAIKRAEARAKSQEVAMKDDRERDKTEMELLLKIKTLEAEQGIKVPFEDFIALAERQRPGSFQGVTQ